MRILSVNMYIHIYAYVCVRCTHTDTSQESLPDLANNLQHLPERARRHTHITNTHTRTHTHTHTHTHVHIYIQMCKHTNTSRADTHKVYLTSRITSGTCPSAHSATHTHTHKKYTHTHSHTHIYIHSSTYTCAYIPINHAHTHTKST